MFHSLWVSSMQEFGCSTVHPAFPFIYQAWSNNPGIHARSIVCQLAKLAHRYHDSKIERWARKSVNCFEALVMKMVNWKHIYLVFFCTARKKYLSHTFSNCPYSRYSQPVGNGLAERTSRSSAPWKNLASQGIKHIPSDHVFNWGEIEIYLPQISWVYLF